VAWFHSPFYSPGGLKLTALCTPIVQIPNSNDVMAEIGATGSARGPQIGWVARTTDEKGSSV
jgi:hypothetical protein